jgi:hypothetical protein
LRPLALSGTFPKILKDGASGSSSTAVTESMGAGLMDEFFWHVP